MRMIRWKNQLIAACIMLAISFGLVLYAAGESKEGNVSTEEKKVSLTIWYTGSLYQTYLNEGARRYTDETGVEILLEQKSKLTFQNEIRQANEEGNAPDLILADETLLQTLLWMGSASKTEFDADYKRSDFATNAFDALEYEGVCYGYPLGFEALVLMYRADAKEELPKDLSTLCTEEKQSIFVWDTENFLYNYAFLAEYAMFDDEGRVDICNENMIEAADCYRRLYRHTGDRSYAQVLDAMATGTAKMAIVKADALVQSELWQDAMQFTSLPDLTEELEMKSPVIVDYIMCNPFSGQRQEANELARYFSLERADAMYEQTLLLPLAQTEGLPQGSEVFYQAFEEGKHLPRETALQGYWSEMSELLGRLRTEDEVDVDAVMTEYQNLFVRKNTSETLEAE